MKENGTIEEHRIYPSPNPNVKLTEITYWSNGIKVKGLLAEPKKEGVYESILYLRGGMQFIGMVRPARISQFAQKGFIVFAPYYRGNRGGEGKDEFAGEDRWDAVHGVEILKRHPRAIPDRIHLYSFSRGGIMALWTAILRNDITSVVVWAGVSDLISTYSERKDMRRMMKRVIGGTPNNNMAAYEERTALYRIDEIEAPVLIVHGMKDENVSFKQAILLEDELREKERVYETWYFPDYTHYFPPQVNRKIVDDVCLWMRRQGK